MNYWMLADIILMLGLLVTTAFIFRFFLGFLNSLAMMVSFYSLSADIDINERCGRQAEMMERYLHIREKAVKNIMYSVLLAAIIIFLRYLLEVLHAAV